MKRGGAKQQQRMNYQRQETISIFSFSRSDGREMREEKGAVAGGRQIKEILAGRRQSGGLRCQKGNWEFKMGATNFAVGLQMRRRECQNADKCWRNDLPIVITQMCCILKDIK